jgi:DNA-binding NtrC family response regulator
LKSLEGGGSALIMGLESIPASVLQMLFACLESHPSVCWMGTCKSPADLPEPLKSLIGVINLELMPLLDRKDDILPIFYNYLADTCKKAGRTVPIVDRSIEKELLGREWLGNVSELVWVATEAARTCVGGLLKELPLPFSAEAKSMLLPRPKKDKLAKMLQNIGYSAERRFLEEALADANGDLAKAAENLGLAAKNYVHKLKNYGISLKNE